METACSIYSWPQTPKRKASLPSCGYKSLDGFGPKRSPELSRYLTSIKSLPAAGKTPGLKLSPAQFSKALQ